jgi:hypothetical protein
VMLRILFTFWLCVILSDSKAQHWQWARKTENLQGIKITQTDDGNVWVIGNFQDSCSVNGQKIYGALSPGGNGILLKFSESGNLLWQKLLHGNGSINFIHSEFNDIYISGNISGRISGLLNDSSTNRNFFFARISSDGDPIFYKKEGGASYIDLSDFEVRNNKLFVAGSFYDSTNVSGNILRGNKYKNVFFARYSENGNLELVKKIAGKGEYNCGVGMIKADESNHIFLYGYFTDTIRIGNDDSVIYFGPYYQYENQIIHFNPDGKVQQVIPHLEGYFSDLRNYFVHKENDVHHLIKCSYDFGCNHCCTGVLLSRIEMNSQPSWKYKFGADYVYSGDVDCMIPGDMVTTDELIFETGWYDGNFLIGNDSIRGKGMCLFKMDHKGNFISVKTIPFDLRPAVMSNISNGSFIVSGGFYGDAWMDNNFLEGGSPVASFIAKYADSELNASVPIQPGASPFKIFPNPGNGDLNIAGLNTLTSLKIYDSSGNLMYENRNAGAHLKVNLPGGIYFYTLIGKNSFGNGKLIIY